MEQNEKKRIGRTVLFILCFWGIVAFLFQDKVFATGKKMYYTIQFHEYYEKLEGKKVEAWRAEDVFGLLEALYYSGLKKDLSALTADYPDPWSNDTSMCYCSYPTPDLVKIYQLMDDFHRLGFWDDKLYHLACLIQLERDKERPEIVECYTSAKTNSLEEIWPYLYGDN